MKGVDFEVFASARTEREITRAFRELDEYMTPLEMAGLVARRAELSGPVLHQLGLNLQLAPFAGREPQRFQRVPVNPDVTLYRDPAIPAGRKKLIVAFCGARNRLDMPLAAALQSLPSREVDIAVLRDRTKHHYFNGIDGYAADFRELANAVVRDFRPEKYRDVYSYGTSMGGFAAVRFALVVPVRRAVSMVGSFPGHVRRLLGARPVPAFDSLCDCVTRGKKADVFSVYGAGYERDRRNSEWLARICGAQEIAVPQVAIHNVAYALAVSGRLAPFFAAMFDLEGALEAWLGLPRPSTLPIVSAA